MNVCVSLCLCVCVFVYLCEYVRISAQMCVYVSVWVGVCMDMRDNSVLLLLIKSIQSVGGISKLNIAPNTEQNLI